MERRDIAPTPERTRERESNGVRNKNTTTVEPTRRRAERKTREETKKKKTRGKVASLPLLGEGTVSRNRMLR